MSEPTSPRVRLLRLAVGWSQEELARRSGLSRPEISAIETERVVPSVKVALALGGALGVSVEELFGAARGVAFEWALRPRSFPCRAWLADVGSRCLAFPCDAAPGEPFAHDALIDSDGQVTAASRPPTLVVAGCDPAVALLRDTMAERGVRVLALVRSSRGALELLKQGLVHAAGVHLAGRSREGNGGAVQRCLGTGFSLLRWAEWEVGVATGEGLALTDLNAARLGRLRWVGRQSGSGAQQWLDRLFRGHQTPTWQLVAHDHREVAQVIRLGAVDAGVCVRVTAAEAGLGFLAIHTEPYDYCYRTGAQREPALRALIHALGDARLRRRLAEVPGYSSKTSGQRARLG